MLFAGLRSSFLEDRNTQKNARGARSIQKNTWAAQSVNEVVKTNEFVETDKEVEEIESQVQAERWRPGDLHWKIVSVYINKMEQEIGASSTPVFGSFPTPTFGVLITVAFGDSLSDAFTASMFSESLSAFGANQFGTQRSPFGTDVAT
ncbi:hypothetical protein Tco_0472101 [Tanacetum coccineum]